MAWVKVPPENHPIFHAALPARKPHKKVAPQKPVAKRAGAKPSRKKR